MSLLARSVLVWLPAFLLLELPPVFWKRCPWDTLSSTVWMSIKWWHPIAMLVTVLMAILYGHFEAHWSARYLIAAAIVGAAVIVGHLIVKEVIF